MEVTIVTPEQDIMKASTYKVALEKLAKNITIENLKFLAELSEKPKVNEKLKAKQGMIKAFL